MSDEEDGCIRYSNQKEVYDSFENNLSIDKIK